MSSRCTKVDWRVLRIEEHITNWFFLLYSEKMNKRKWTVQVARAALSHQPPTTPHLFCLLLLLCHLPTPPIPSRRLRLRLHMCFTHCMNRYRFSRGGPHHFDLANACRYVQASSDQTEISTGSCHATRCCAASIVDHACTINHHEMNMRRKRSSETGCFLESVRL